MTAMGPSAWFQSLRYGLVARTMARLNRRYRFTGSPEFRPRVVPALEKACVLCISPHPDDDVIAIGGAMAGHRFSGGAVHSIVMTDGVCGTSDASAVAGLREIRRRESECAAEILNLQSILFRNEPDGKLNAHPRIVEDIRAMIVDLRPDYIYTPFPIDYHFDHIAATRIILNAVSQLPDPPLLRCYESIIPLIPNRIIDVTDFIDVKRRAVECFETQNAVTDYCRTIVEGLNRHRSYGEMKGRGYGEAIFESDWRCIDSIDRMMHGSGD